MRELRFQHGERELTLWPEKIYADGWVIGWCPELARTMAVPPANVIYDSVGEADA